MIVESRSLLTRDCNCYVPLLLSIWLFSSKRESKVIKSNVAILSLNSNGDMTLGRRDLKIGDLIEVEIDFQWYSGWVDNDGEKFFLIDDENNEHIRLNQGMRARTRE